MARYDMLCFEGISLMLNIFRGKQKSPVYRLIPPENSKLETITAHKEVSPSFRAEQCILLT